MEKLLQEARIWILIGESGCGKTELALHLAGALRSAGAPRVQLLDMDQTKGMFRARDFRETLEAAGVTVAAGPHFLDMPVVPPGVERMLEDREAYSVLDVGGNEMGAVTLGQFSRWTNGPETAALYLVNPYRSFSGTLENLRLLLEGIQAAGRLRRVRLVCNPNLGPDTTERDVLEGYERLTGLLEPAGLRPEALVLPRWVGRESFEGLGLPLYQITPYIQYP